MQLRYLGDTVDFGKYYLLKSLAGSTAPDKFGPLRIGVNWYQTDPGDVGDSHKNHGLKKGNSDLLNRIDPDLAAKLPTFEDPKRQSFAVFRRLEVLPENTLYHEEVLSLTASLERSVKLRRRSAWHGQGLVALEGADIVLLDPDNGLEPQSAGAARKNGPRHAYLNEVADYIRREQTVVITQFPGMNKPAAGVAADCIRKLSELADGDVEVHAVRYTANASVLFLVVVAREHRKAIHSRLKALFAGPASDVFEHMVERNPLNW